MAKPATNHPPTRTEFERLKQDYQRLHAEVETLRLKLQEQAGEMKTQFIRIAEMQAILDEERIAAGRPRIARPLFPASRDG